MNYRRVVLGIGNPGPEYDDTRHNAGFIVLDRLAACEGVTFRRLDRRASFGPDRPDGPRSLSGKVKAQVALVEGGRGLGPDPVLLVKPLSYVNLSGEVAGPLLRVYGLGPESLFIVVDDLNLPLGRIRIRPSGSSGGHNGLKSIEQILCTNAYPRLRLGIGQPVDRDPRVSASSGGADAADFVLARFLPEEREVLRLVVERCADVATQWCTGTSVETLMERHNAFGANPGGGASRAERAPGDRES